MMPVIRISDATWQRLKGYAQPLEDSAEDVVSRALDALDAVTTGRGRPTGAATLPSKRLLKTSTTSEESKLPQKEFRVPLTETLIELGGRAHVKDVRGRLLSRIAHRLSEMDYQKVSSGDPRWWNAACWERNDMVKDGVLRGDSERGVWELAPGYFVSETSTNAESNSRKMTWRDDLVTVLDRIDQGMGASLSDIYREVRQLRSISKRSVPNTLEATVRQTLESHGDTFFMPHGKGAGIWGLCKKQAR